MVVREIGNRITYRAQYLNMVNVYCILIIFKLYAKYKWTWIKCDLHFYILHIIFSFLLYIKVSIFDLYSFDKIIELIHI